MRGGWLYRVSPTHNLSFIGKFRGIYSEEFPLLPTLTPNEHSYSQRQLETNEWTSGDHAGDNVEVTRHKWYLPRSCLLCLSETLTYCLDAIKIVERTA